MWTLFDYQDGREPPRNLIAEWTRDLPTPTQAKLNARLDLIARDNENQKGSHLPPQVMSGPLKGKNRHLYEIKVPAKRGSGNVRVLTCRGPVDPRQEVTLLFGHYERDNRPVPRNATEIGQDRFEQVQADPRRRCPHEQVPPTPTE